MALPEQVDVLIEVTRGGFIKPRAHGGVDFISPLPSPFNYGSVPNTLGDDGDPLDALVLGDPIAVGQTVTAPVLGVVRFVDNGDIDDKLVCGDTLTTADEARVKRFFRAYAWAKGALNLARGKTGETAYRGFSRRSEDDRWKRWRAT